MDDSHTSVRPPDSAPELQQIEFYQKILDAITDMVLCKSEGSRIVWANKAFRDYYGMSNERLRNMIDAPFNEPDFTQQYIRDDHYVFSSGKPLDIPDEPVTRHDGAVHTFHTVKSAIFDRAGKVRLTVGVSRDISEQKRIQNELDEYRRRLEELVAERTKELQDISENLRVTLHALTEGVISVCGDGLVRLANEAALALLGRNAEEVLAKPLRETLVLREEGTGTALQILPVSEKRRVPRCAILTRADGAEIPVEFQVAPIRRNDGNVLCSVLVLRDLTEARRLEARVVQQQKLDSLGTLAGGIAHDFNNFLQSVLGNITMAQLHASGNPDLQALLGRAEAACNRAQSVTRQLLAFSKGGKPLKRVQSIASVLHESASFAVRGSSTVVRFDLPASLWSCPIDDGQIAQVISNMVINSDQAMPNGGTITISARNIERPADRGFDLPEGHYVEVRVADQGSGISRKNLAKIFDPYFTTKEAGNGLGLSTAYTIIKNHGGAIHVNSEPGSGTEMIFLLPAAPTAAAGREGQDTTRELGRGERVLCLDDDDLIRDSLRRMLELLGYKPVECSSADAAVRLYREAVERGEPFDCVILDLTIPGGRGGDAVFLEMRKITPELKGIVSSGYSEQTSGDALEAVGFSAVLPKPYTLQQLSRTLRDTIDGRAGAIK